MAAYAGFRNIQDYLAQRLRRDELSQNALSEIMGWRRNYINSVMHGLFVPSRRRCDALARHFGDDAHLVRVLAGHESPEPSLEDRQIREIYDLAVALSAEQRREAIRFLRSLTDRGSQ